MFGGSAPGATSAANESWDGTSWTEQDDLATARSTLGGAGATSSSALAFGGYAPPGVQNATEEFTVPEANKTITVS